MQSQNEVSNAGSDAFETKRHIGYLLHHLRSIPVQMTTLDTNRLTLLYFVVSALDLLCALDNPGERQPIIDYVYAHQVVPELHGGGFAGLFLGRRFDASGTSTGDGNVYERGHVAMTYVALAILRILGDDLSRVNVKAITAGLRELQSSDGSLAPVAGSECVSLSWSHPHSRYKDDGMACDEAAIQRRA